MKAKEYAEIFDSTEDKMEALQTIINYFTKDLSELIEQRKIGRPDALKSAIDEVDMKWKAFAKHVKSAKIKPEGFRMFLIEHHPRVYYLGEQ